MFKLLGPRADVRLADDPPTISGVGPMDGPSAMLRTDPKVPGRLLGGGGTPSGGPSATSAPGALRTPGASSTHPRLGGA
eukprot:10077224-Lingulodinium_polyedra.AAC.1